MKKIPPALPLLVFAVLVALFAAPLLRGTDPSLVPSAMIGKAVPHFALGDALGQGRGFSDADLKAEGRVSLVNVFSSWCVTCVAEHPVLSKCAADVKTPLYGIDYKDKPGAIGEWLAKRGNPYKTIGFDGEGRVAIDWGVYGVPETYVVDRQGIIRYRYVGPLTEEDCAKILKPLVQGLQK